MAVVRIQVVISGQVQGVGFRLAARRKMEDLGIEGVVTNLPDGRVEAVFAGKADRVREMVKWCQEGPPLAQVSQVAVTRK